MTNVTSLAGVVSYGAGTIAYAILTVIVAIGFRKRQVPLFMAACALTATWAGTHAYAYWSGADVAMLASLLGLARSLAWIAFLWSVLRDNIGAEVRRVLARVLTTVVAAVVILKLAFGVAEPALESTAIPIPQLLDLVLVVVGFALIENLIRNSSAEQRWQHKFLCISMGGLYVFDLFFFADSLLFRKSDIILEMSRGAIYAISAILLYVYYFRLRPQHPFMPVSQKTAVYTTALITSGLYLVLMSAAAFYVNAVGGSWGPVIQAVFLFGALLLLTIIVSSGSFRAHIKVLISKHFFPYKYDYRQEWRRFTQTVSEPQRATHLEHRVIAAIADPLDSTGGALWLRQHGSFGVVATWNMAAPSLNDDEVGALVHFMREKEWIIDIKEVVSEPARYGGLTVPEAVLRLKDAWIIVPLLHRSDLIGFVVLARPRAARSLDWEDYDLLRMLGRQTASYLAQHRAAQELAEARQFERFSRRATFVMHDIKNLVSQLSLVSTNIDKHGHNPEFRKDMTAVMNDAVAGMRRLMERLHVDQDTTRHPGRVTVRPLLDRVVTVHRQAPIEVRCEDGDDDIAVAADPDRLAAIIAHVVDNAVDASGATGWVRIALSRKNGAAVVEVTDSGPGMDPLFVKNELFKPFRSTKQQGFGIGAFQCRQYARELGGDVEVVSSPGAGTTMRIILPLAGAKPPLAIPEGEKVHG